MRQIRYFPAVDILDSSFMKVSLRADFQDEITTLRRAWEINADEMTDSEWLDFMQNTNLIEELNLALSKLDIHPKWEEQALSFLLTGVHKGGRQINPNGIRLELPLEGDKRPVIIVGAESTFADLKNAWNSIPQEFRATDRRRKKRITDIESTIYLLVNNGLSLSEVSEKLIDKYGKHGDMDYGNIKKIYSKFCTEIRIPKGKRKRLRTN